MREVVAEGSIEGLDEAFCMGFAGLDVVDGDACDLSPEMEGAPGRLGAVVGGDGGGQATGGSELLEDSDDGGPADGSIDVQGQALAGEVT